MNYATKAASVSILLCMIAYLMSLNAIQAQETVSSHFGAGATRSASAVGGTIPVQSAGAGGGSNWGAGKGSFAQSAQRGGVWRDGSTLGAATGTTHNAAPVHTSAGGELTAGSSGAQASGARGSVASGTANLSHSSSARGSVSKSSSMSHGVGGSLSRAGSLGRGIGRGGTRRPSSFGSSLAQHGRTKESIASPSLRSGLNTGLGK
jgi:hypothetical protein